MSPTARGLATKKPDLTQPRDPHGKFDFKVGGNSDLLTKRGTDFPGPFTPPEEMDLDDIAPLPPGVPDPTAGPRTFRSIYDDDPWIDVSRGAEMVDPVGPREAAPWVAGGDQQLHDQLQEANVTFRAAERFGHPSDGAAIVTDSSGDEWILMRNLKERGAFTLDNFQSKGADGVVIPFANRRDLLDFLSETPGADSACRCGDMCFC